MKVSIIGGGGLVGSSAAFALQCGGVVRQIDLIDLNADQVKGQALDLLHGASLAADQRIRATGYEAIPESDAVIITAGLRRKPDESRLDLINRNVELFLNILGQVSAAGLSIRDVIHSVALDQKRIQPVSSLVDGPYGLRDVCLSVPTVVGRTGVEGQLEIELWPKEVAALQHSGQVLRETIDAVMK